MAGRQDDAAERLVLADDVGGGRRRQDAALPDQHRAEAIGRGHADRDLDDLAVVVAAVAADHQRLALRSPRGCRRSTGRSSRHSSAAGTPAPSCAGPTCRASGRRRAWSRSVLIVIGCLRPEEVCVEVGVFARRSRSQETSAFMPRRCILRQTLSVARRARSRGGSPRRSASAVAGANCDAGGDARLERRLVGVDHRVGEAAGARDDRHAAVAQAVELGQPAGLEARRDQDRVAAALHQVRQRLVIADARRRPGRGCRAARRQQAAFERRRRPSRAPPAAPPMRDQLVEHADQQVHALLPGQPADHARTAGRRRASSPKRSSTRLAVGGARLQRLGGVRSRRGAGRSRGFQTSVSMPLTMPCRSVGARAEQPVEPHAELRRADLLRHRSG